MFESKILTNVQNLIANGFLVGGHILHMIGEFIYVYEDKDFASVEEIKHDE